MATVPSSFVTESDIPKKIGRFTPLEVLGRGGQGVVYLAKDPDLERKVAIKTLLTGNQDPARLAAEAKNVAQLDHPGIVPLYEIDLDEGRPYLVYQYVRGLPLEQWLKRDQLRPPHESAELILRILEAMAYAHDKGVVHRDLSPRNIIVDENGNPKVLDFGAGSLVDNLQPDDGLIGTINYLPPESLSNGQIGPHSDVFSISAIFHEMLTGRRVFEAENPMAVIYKIVNEDVSPPSVRNRAVERALDEIVMHGIARNAEQRYRNAGEMRVALDDYLHAGSDSSQTRPDAANGAIEYMLRRTARKPDFPSVSRYISEINQKTGSRDRADASELADVILKDYALTSKLLKLVNSSLFGHYGGSIGTVSRAVVILGFDQVRAAALGIAVFEHLQNGEQADALKDATCSAFLSAVLARDLAELDPEIDPEEAFIGALFHRLGKHLAIFYFPEEYNEVKALISSKGISERAAVHEVFGASYSAFGIAVGEQWNLPREMLQCMKPPKDGKVEAGTDRAQKTARCAALANELAELCGTAEDINELNSRLTALIDRYENCMTLENKTIRKNITAAISSTREYATILNIDLGSAEFFGNVLKRFRSEQDEPGAQVSAEDDIDPAATISHMTPLAQGKIAENERKSFLVNAIGRLTTAMLDNVSPNEVLTLVVDSIYRGMGFSNVLLMIRDPKRHMMQARSGLGADVETIAPQFSFKTGQQQDIFNQAVRKGKEFVILDVDSDSYRDLVPDWCRELTSPQSIVLFPIMVNKHCIGLIYGEQTQCPARISAEEFKLLVTLVKQASLAIQQRA